MKSDHAIKSITLAFVILFGLGYLGLYLSELDRCDKAGGVLVRGIIWYQCVDPR